MTRLAVALSLALLARTCAAQQASPPPPTMYEGGVVMTAPINVYMLWYGNTTASSLGPTLLPTLIAGLSGSAYWNVTTNGYWEADGKHVSSLDLV